MKYTIHDRLLKRELGDPRRYSQIRGIYGDRAWVDELDIVNELGGHSGCVNALSWSRSGKLLASGSDDTHVNIHSYLPDTTTNQFALTTTISTGHTQNIFSVKFMPHSDDRTIVTAAGDGEVRIFDIEYSGQSQSSLPSRGANLGSTVRSRGLNNVVNGVRYLSQADTGAKVFRSHSDRVKRIVTESSPYFFLTCSEDGEVRQWDVRQPESAYPPARSRFASGNNSGNESNVPPPLISYKRYHLDLNTISCSPSQPHYIALGGAHLHCFLHDRRMLGRDRLAERGARLASPSSQSEHDDELMGQATQCVRKFSPKGQQRMKRTDNGHITACKISDADPNEIVVSWSGESIYSFDLLRSPDAREESKEPPGRISSGSGKARVKESKDRKRKRTKAGSTVSQEGAERAGSRARTESSSGTADVALRVQYQNGQTEEIPIEPPRARSPTSEAFESVIPESQRRSFRIARHSVHLRKHLFTPGSSRQPSPADPTGHAISFHSAVGFAAAIIPDMDEISRTWRYPVNPLDVDVAFQKRLKSNRESSRRFVQAAGTLARVLGGKLLTAGSGTSPALEHFVQIQLAPNEGLAIAKHEQFGYDFLKAILLWLDSGVGALLQGFIRPFNVPRGHPRFPIPQDACADAVDDVLIPYLLRLASDKPVVNLDASRFEVDENRVVFATEKAAVLAFAQAVKIPFEDLSRAVVLRSDAGEGAAEVSRIEAQDRLTALRFWGYKVGRGVLMNAGEGVNFQFVDFAFGGLGRADESVREDEANLRTRLERIDPDEEEDVVESATIVSRSCSDVEMRDSSTSSAFPDASAARSLQSPSQGVETPRQPHQATVEDEDEVASSEAVEASTSTIGEASVSGTTATEEEEENNDTEDEDADGDAAENDSEDDDEDDSDSDSDSTGGRFIWRSAFERSKLRERVELDVPCSSHTRVYRGHCNVKTVKDVNFFGLQDEYVVSGSDSGHLFIWDRKTSQLVNILEGDGEVVNVVQGHPYEPMLAVSGIDHTVKIFSPDARARRDARLGVGVRPADPTSFSSLAFGRMRRVPRRNVEAASANTASATATGESAMEARVDDNDDEEYVAPNGLSSRRRMADEYRITSQNDVDRRGGNRGEPFITRTMLAHLAARMRERAEADEEGYTGPIVLTEEDCTVM